MPAALSILYCPNPAAVSTGELMVGTIMVGLDSGVHDLQSFQTVSNSAKYWQVTYFDASRPQSLEVDLSQGSLSGILTGSTAMNPGLVVNVSFQGLTQPLSGIASKGMLIL